MKKTGNSSEMADKNTSERIGTNIPHDLYQQASGESFKVPGNFFNLNINKE